MRPVAVLHLIGFPGKIITALDGVFAKRAGRALALYLGQRLKSQLKFQLTGVCSFLLRL